MPRRRNSGRGSANSESRSKTRFTRSRRRRRLKNIDPQREMAPAEKMAEQKNADGQQARDKKDMPPSPPRSRAPRSAEPPPPDPAVFSYTYTIWKSS